MTYLGKAVPTIVLALLLVVVACTTTDAADADADAAALTPEDREAIEALFTEFADRVMASDWEGYAGLFHGDGSRKYPGTPHFLEGRDAIFEAVVAMDASFDHFEISVLELDGTPQLAYVIVHAEAIYMVDGEEGRGDASGLSIVQPDEDGTWRIYREIHHSNL